MTTSKRDLAGFSFRSFAPAPATVREDGKERSVEFIASTEDPARVFDWDRYDFVDEVLLMKGMRVPDNGQVPFLDSHNRGSVDDVLGSFREIKIEGNKAIGRAFFSQKDKAKEAFQDVRDGHITDVSVGYRVDDYEYINEGESREIDGRSYKGPLKLSKAWSLKEVSLTPIGADPNAKARSEATKPEINPAATGNIKQEVQKTVENLEIKTVQTPPAPVVDTEKVIAEATRAERSRVEEIRAASVEGVTPEMQESAIKNGTSADEYRKAVIAHLATKAKPLAKIEMGETDGEKFRAEAAEGMVIKAGKANLKLGQARNNFAGMSMVRFAEECLRRDGVNTRGMSNSEIAKRALVSSSSLFVNVLATSANKALQTAYEAEASTFEAWCRITAAADYRTIDRVQLSDAPALGLIQEGADYPMAQPSDAKESFSIKKYGEMFCLSREVIINDDLAAFARIPAMFGAAARRKINDLAYGILTTNAALGSDSTALFEASSHKNYASSSAALAQATLAAGRAAMRIQTGPKGTPLNLVPKFLIVPAALQTTAEILINSMSIPGSTSGILNPFYNTMQIVVESRLDASDTDMWYLAASPSQIDTVEVAFLDGNTAPYIEEETEFDNDSRKFKVRIEVGAKAIDFRGLYCARNS